jgi:2-polyprenyl-6-methoxyphenol hydroxylase-like FAD-dependent oxidoreductase
MATVTVLGGGYAGIMAALRLRRLGHHARLVDPGEGLLEMCWRA